MYATNVAAFNEQILEDDESIESESGISNQSHQYDDESRQISDEPSQNLDQFDGRPRAASLPVNQMRPVQN